MGDRLATTEMDRKLAAAVSLLFFGGGAGASSNTMWLGPRPTSVPKAILISSRLASIDMGEKLGALPPF